MKTIFVYGTLMYDEVLMQLIGRVPEHYKDSLDDYKKEGLNIFYSPGDKVEGLLLSLTEAEKWRIDRYESLGELYKEIPVVTHYGVAATAYQLIDSASHAVSPFDIKNVTK